MPNSQIAQNVFKQTEMIYPDVRKSALRSYIKYKGYYEKEANASNLKEKDYVYVLEHKAGHQGTKISSTEFWWIAPDIIEKALPNINFLVCKTGTDKTQALHRMTLLQFTPKQPIPDVQMTPRKWKCDPENTLTHDDLYTRAWECENEKPTFDKDYDNAATPNSSETAVQSDLTADETSITRGTSREDSHNFFRKQTDYVTEGRRIPPWILMRKRVPIDPALLLSIPAVWNTTYVTIRNLIALVTTDIEV